MTIKKDSKTFIITRHFIQRFRERIVKVPPQKMLDAYLKGLDRYKFIARNKDQNTIMLITVHGK